MRHRHQQVAERRQRGRDADDARLVASKSEVPDEDDDGDVHDVVARLDETRLRTAQSEPALQGPQDPGRVRVADHPEQDNTADDRRKDPDATVPSSTAAAAGFLRHRGAVMSIRRFRAGIFHSSTGTTVARRKQ